ncbi:MAG: type II secretion system F family protein, partial [Epsilonproteobacteria bacterium]|nr:type II secretion system F family protein [Campylobacterota bacterium]
MPKYVVKYYDTRAGTIDVDEIEARSEEEIIGELLQYRPNLILLDIRPKSRVQEYFLKVQKINIKELEDFCYHVGNSINIGIDILQSIRDFIEQTSSSKLQYVLKKIVHDLENGTSFSQALKKHKDFPPNLVAMCEISEVTGMLGPTLIDYSKYLRWLIKLRASVKKALTYPFIVLFVTSITIAVMLFWVLPKIIQVFKSLQLEELPLPTEILIWVTNNKIYFLYFFLFLFGAFTLIKILTTINEEFRYLYDKWILKLPVFGRLIFLHHIAEDLKAIRDLYKTGSTLVESIKLIYNELEKNLYIKKTFEQIYRSINNGYSLYEAFEQSGLFSKMVLRTILIGENTGKLDESLQRTIDFYEEEVKNTLEQ